MRVVYERQWKQAERQGVHDRREHLMTVGIALSQGIPAWIWIATDRLAVADVVLPLPLRWLGLGLTLAGLASFLWVHATLGRNFSPRLDMRADHTLVTSGPYRWVRHPMYTTNFVLVLGYFLLSANLAVLVPALVMLLVLVVVRVPDEEAMVRARFGAEWDAWAARTGRFLPRLFNG
ncbi:MAG: DUF1295 domain-containing protein [Alphaproteobacteria bacterium]|nr:DUF1295 domain-containing protein [Alphaproteobacteria bacterium]